jgi:hypothetical protein
MCWRLWKVCVVCWRPWNMLSFLVLPGASEGDGLCVGGRVLCAESRGTCSECWRPLNILNFLELPRASEDE